MSIYISLKFLFLLVSFVLPSIFFVYGESKLSTFEAQPFYIGGDFEVNIDDRFVNWSSRRVLLAEADGPSGEPDINSTYLILAARRTRRKDPLNGFNEYTGGWNISEPHYWASVAFTAVPFFIISAAWFSIFGICLLSICLYYCCCRTNPYGYSKIAYALSLILLVIFTLSAIVGCFVLYMGQAKFHNSTQNTLKYVVSVSRMTVGNLGNVSQYLSAAKGIRVEQVNLGSNIQSDIDRIQNKISSASSTLDTRTKENARKIKSLLNAVMLALIIIAAAMLILAFLGFLSSIFGMDICVYFFVVIGWIFVTGTFILCGIFLLLHNVTGDTCVAMNQWDKNPTAHTALDDILPCIDNATAQDTLTKSKEVTSQVVNVINQVINNVSNKNFSSNSGPLYYNQSGPLLPILCNPFNADLTNRTCSAEEVDLGNASEEWKSYECQISDTEICKTTGRLTPRLYRQMAGGLNISYALYTYTPFLVDLEDCSLVRQTFSKIYTDHCPGLRHYSKWIYVGLLMVSVAVMLSLIFWVLFSRERNHRHYTKIRDNAAARNASS